MIQHTLTLKMTSTQVVKTSVTLNNNSPIQDYIHPDDHTQPTWNDFWFETFHNASNNDDDDNNNNNNNIDITSESAQARI